MWLSDLVSTLYSGIDTDETPCGTRYRLHLIPFEERRNRVYSNSSATSMVSFSKRREYCTVVQTQSF